MGRTRKQTQTLRCARRRAGIAVAALAAFAMALAPLPSAAAQTESSQVSIPDGALRGAIEQALNKQSGDSITRGDMAGLTYLDARNSGIQDLSGLQHATNLRTLYLHGNRVSDASSLTGLSKMQFLFLPYNDISSIDVRQMTDLRFLNLGGNELTTVDLSSQRTRTGFNSRLYALWLNDNDLTSFDLTGLTALDDTSGSNSDPSLISLRLDGNKLTSVTGMSGLPDAVWSLKLENNQLTSVDLRGAEHIHYLYLDRNPISSTGSLTGLSGLTDLKRLHLYETRIGSIDLSPFSRLERAFLNDNNLTSVDVTGLDRIQRLWLRGNRISSITGLDDIADTLLYLNLRTNRLADIDLSELTNLRQLYLSDNGLTSVDVTALTQLQVLWLHNNVDTPTGRIPNPAYTNQITSLGTLPDSLTDLRLTGNSLDTAISVSSRTGLTKLYLSGDQISDVSQVAGLTGLAELGLTDMRLTGSDLSSLSRLTGLQKLDLSGNLIVDLSPLASATGLTELRLDGNSVADLSPLSSLAALEDLYIARNRIGDFSPLDDLVADGLRIHGSDAQVAGSPENYYWDIHSGGPVNAQYLSRLAADGVLDNTQCGPDLICPNLAIERWVVAIWVVRVADGGDPEPLGFNRFTDVHPGLQWAAHAERIAELGVTAGCSAEPPLFCPQNRVTRAQMASLLVRAFDIPAGEQSAFVDVERTSAHAADIDAIAAAGITSGCAVDPTRYCPDDYVSRGQTATLLARALDYSVANSS